MFQAKGGEEEKKIGLCSDIDSALIEILRFVIHRSRPLYNVHFLFPTRFLQ
jgi:hypothetical protein